MMWFLEVVIFGHVPFGINYKIIKLDWIEDWIILLKVSAINFGKINQSQCSHLRKMIFNEERELRNVKFCRRSKRNVVNGITWR